MWREQWLARKREQIEELRKEHEVWSSGRLRFRSRNAGSGWGDDTESIILSIERIIAELERLVVKVEAGDTNA